ncbi:hypothetical protein Fmac_008697 [Flemingia macrophylla]|uniref:Uncharacterized protein n=1 Tax=Flemingia macrophylla TaxID=520843 RepID=A0ABD1MZ09_9FABA
MLSWWGKSSSKEVKKKPNREGSHLPVASVANSRLILSSKLERAICSKPSLHFPLPKPSYVSNKEYPTYAERDIDTSFVSSDSSVDSGNSFDSPHIASSMAFDYGNGKRANINSYFRWVCFLTGQMFWPQNRCSLECFPILSPIMTSPGPSSRIQIGTVTPLHPQVGGTATEAPTKCLDDVKQQTHQLPICPITVISPYLISPTYFASTTPLAPYSHSTSENLAGLSPH